MVQKPVGQQGLHDGQFVVLGRRLHHGEFGRRVEVPRLNHGEEVAHHLGGGERRQIRRSRKRKDVFVQLHFLVGIS